MIDLLKDVPVPLYHQLKEIIISKINSGELKAGKRIPSEQYYIENFNISRTTVRQAISDLIIEGYLYRVRGKGTYVSSSKINQWLAEDLTSLTWGMEKRGLGHETVVLKQNVITSDDTMALKLHIKNKSKLFNLERLILIKGEPLALTKLLSPLKFFPDIINIDFSKESFHKTIYAKYNLKIVKADRYFEATIASKEDAEILKLPEGSPIMYVEVISYLSDSTPVEWAYAKFIGSRSRFHVRLGE
ncbi:MAG: GntR family transcriptional regulator [Actinobacteria bacterium]|nr:GntR family transcriptional regulator [Actinomycetota bacterium]